MTGWALVGAALIWDAWAYKTGRRTMSYYAGRVPISVWGATSGLLVAHFAKQR